MARPLAVITLTAYTLLIQVLLFVSPTCARSPTGGLSQSNSSAEDIDLVSFFSSRTQNQDAIFAEAVHLLDSMKSSPSCNRLAASRLVTSCRSIGGKSDTVDTDMYVTLERIRSLYAARLAICEINGAGASTPPPCLPVTMFVPARKGMFSFSRHRYQSNSADSLYIEALEPCLRSLESRPQWWTSYSNNRQNAVVICQAARIENEREELLEIHRSIVESSARLNQGLQEALRAAAEDSAQYKAFLHATEGMRLRVLQDLEETRFRFSETFQNLILDVEGGVHSIFVAVKSAFGNLQAEVTTVEKDISSETHRLQQTLKSAHADALARHEELAVAQKQASLAHTDLASSLNDQLGLLSRNKIPELSRGIERFDTSIEWLYERFVSLLQQELIIAERLRDFETSLEKSRQTARILQSTQLQQVKTFKEQTKLQQTLSDNLRITQAILDKVVATTANIQTVLDETTNKYKRIPVLGGLFNTLSPWTVCAFLIGITGAQNSRCMTVFLAIGAVHLLVTKFY